MGYRKLFFVFLFPPILIFIPYDYFEFAKSIYYIIPSCALFSTGILLNFPKILHILHARKTTIEDLHDVRSKNKKIKNRFIVLFEISLTFMLTIVVALVIDYYLNKISLSNLSSFEILGVIGGILSLISKIESSIGKFLLSILKKYREQEIINIDYSTSAVEMIEFRKVVLPENYPSYVDNNSMELP